MHGDFSRWTFDRGAGYRSVLLQQGRVLLDADFNEQAAITAHHDETRMLDVAGRAGGPVDGAGFALVDAAGAAPDGTAWDELHVTPGRFYVDGVLAEAAATEEGPGHPLAAQPHLRGNDEQPGLAEPEADGRYAAVLDVFTHHVTADEAPQLLESALGGPDTAIRGQTVWQVALRAVDPDEICAAARDAAAEPPRWRTSPRSRTRARSRPPTATGGWRTSSIASRSTRWIPGPARRPTSGRARTAASSPASTRSGRPRSPRWTRS